MTEVEIPYEPLAKGTRKEVLIPDLANTETTEWQLPPDLDLFFTRIYTYWKGKGFYSNLLHEILNLLALLFMFLFSVFLLFIMNWSFVTADCSTNEADCSMSGLFHSHPLQAHRLNCWTILKLLYLSLFLLFWIGTLTRRLKELCSSWYIKEFCRVKLGISEEQVKWISWTELVHRLVLVQQTTRLCLKKTLNEQDIINRILRKENYLIGMINKGVLGFSVSFPGLKRRILFTKTMEWNLQWGLLNPMFDKDFQIKSKYRSDAFFLKTRFQHLALLNLVLAPFLLVFLILHFIMFNAEKMYQSPGSLLERTWCLHACWKLREFNELEHQFDARKSMSQKPAKDYLNQFPSYSLMNVGKLFSFVFGSFVAWLLCVALLDDHLLESGMIMGHSLVWWAAILTIGLKISRGLIPENPILDPEECLQETVKHTHYYPKTWRAHARSKEVQESFARMFRFRALNFLDEVISLLLGPHILYYSLAPNSDLIIQFLQNYTMKIEGIGDICSLAGFDFEKHGNANYAAPYFVAKQHQSQQGKMEKSFLTFMETYPSWKPDHSAQRMVQNLEPFLISSVHETHRFNLLESSYSSSRDLRKKSHASSIEMSQLSSKSLSNGQQASTQNPEQNSFPCSRASVRHNDSVCESCGQSSFRSSVNSSSHRALEAYYQSRTESSQ